MAILWYKQWYLPTETTLLSEIPRETRTLFRCEAASSLVPRQFPPASSRGCQALSPTYVSFSHIQHIVIIGRS